MLLDSPCSKHQNRRLAAINLHNPLLPWPGYEAEALPRVPVASALSSMSSFLLHSLISDGRTLRVTTGLSLLMAPARQRYVRLNEKEHRRGRKWWCLLYMCSSIEKTINGLYKLTCMYIVHTTIIAGIQVIFKTFIFAYHFADASLVSLLWLLDSIFVSTVTSWFPLYEAEKHSTVSIATVWFMCSSSNNTKNMHMCKKVTEMCMTTILN